MAKRLIACLLAGFMCVAYTPAAGQSSDEIRESLENVLVEEFKTTLRPNITVWTVMGEEIAQVYADESDIFEALLSNNGLNAIAVMSGIGRRWEFDLRQIKDANDLLLVLPYWRIDIDVLVRGWPELQAVTRHPR